jgi:hypothetical protein
MKLDSMASSLPVVDWIVSEDFNMVEWEWEGYRCGDVNTVTSGVEKQA